MYENDKNTHKIIFKLKLMYQNISNWNKNYNSKKLKIYRNIIENI